MLRLNTRQPPTPSLTTTMTDPHLPTFVNDGSSSSSSGLRRPGDRYNPITIDDYRPLQRRRTHRSGDRHYPISITDDGIPIITIPDSPERSDHAATSAFAAASSSAAAFAAASSSSAAAAADAKGKRPFILSDPDAHCSICMDDKFSDQLFPIHRCHHRYCASCVSQYVTAKVEDNVGTIRCPDPDCKTGVLEPEMCQEILPPAVFERWGLALCEMLIGSMKLYCPYKDCSALFINDGGEDGNVVTDAECPHCLRWLCAKCKVPWHKDFTCEQFQAMRADSGSDDLMVMKMAEEQKWQRCPACHYYVEKTEGCLFVKCRCGTSFCYTCGTKTARDHFCAKCTPNFGLQLQFGHHPLFEHILRGPPGLGQRIPPPQVPPPLLGLRLQLGQVAIPPPPPQNFLPPGQLPQPDQLLQQAQLRELQERQQAQLRELQERQQAQLRQHYQLMQLQEQLGQQVQRRQ